MRKITNQELNRPSPEEFKNQQKFPFVFVLDNIRSALNVGSVFRTADAFAAEELILCGITATPPNRDIEKTALGATDTVRWRHASDSAAALKELKKNNFTIIAVEQTDTGIPLNRFLPEKEKKYAFVFGHEVFGVNENLIPLCDAAVEIPQTGTKHSLNVSVSAGIIAWDYYSKIRQETNP